MWLNTRYTAFLNSMFLLWTFHNKTTTIIYNIIWRHIRLLAPEKYSFKFANESSMEKVKKMGMLLKLVFVYLHIL